MIRLVFYLSFLLVAATARAQTPAPPSAPALTPEQARQALQVLQDPVKRAQTIAVLEALAKAAPPAAAAPAANPAPASKPAATPPAATPPAASPQKPEIPLAPDSLGAQVLLGASAWLANLQSRALFTARTIADLPLLWRFTVSMFSDHWSQRLLLDIAWRLAVVAAAALAAQFLAQLVLRRPMRSLAAHARALNKLPGPGEGPPEASGLEEAERGQTEQLHQQRPLAVLLLRRLPLVLVRLALELLPVLAALSAGYGVLAVGLGSEPVTRLTILALLDATILCRAVMSLARCLVGPDLPRLLPVRERVATYVLRWLRRIAGVGFFGYALAEIGQMFGIYNGAYEALIRLIALTICILLSIVILQCRAAVARRIRARNDATGGVAVLRNQLARVWHILAILYVLALWLVWALRVQHGFSLLLRLSLVTAVILVVARLVSVTLTGALNRWISVPPEVAERYPGLEARVRAYHPVARALVQLIVGSFTLLALLQAWGVNAFAWFSTGRLGERMVSALLVIFITVAASLAVWEGANAALERHLDRLTREAQAARAARLRTLLPMFRTTLLVSICLVAGLMVLGEVGVNILPLLAGASVIGIAVGFGSQKLVQDIITGLFLLLENTMQVGDIVTLANLTGTIEKLSVRTIRLRALDGSVYVIPFSAVTTVTNLTRDYAYAVLDVEVSVNEDPDRICEVLRDLSREMRGEERWGQVIRDDIEVLGVDKFLATTFVVRARVRTVPAQRWAVAREFNRRIKHRFDELGIESPMTSYKVLHSAPSDAPAAAPAGGR